MKDIEYIVKQGDTLGQIAYRYTGNKDNWTGLLGSNPQIPKYTDSYGQKRFVPSHFQVGQIIRVPYSWHEQAQQRGGMLSGVGEIGTVGASCDPSPVTPHPTAYYKVHGAPVWESEAAAEFGQITSGGWGDYATLAGANVGWPFGFYSNAGGGGCRFNQWKAGALVRVPKHWLDGLSTAQLAGLKAFPHLYFEDGVTKWTPAADVKPPECPAGYLPDGKGGCTQIGGDGKKTAATCDPGFVIDPATGLCIKGAATTVGAKEEGTKTSTILWLLLAAGAGIGGALLLNNLIKSRKVYGPPPHSAGALPAKGETVVRR